MDQPDVFIHPTAEVHGSASIGAGTKIWNWSKVRERAVIGAGCNLGQGVFVDFEVRIGELCKIQNGVSVYHGVTLGDRVFLGPHCVFTNDLLPRAVTHHWPLMLTVLEDGVSVGANATIVCGITLGANCMIGSGAVVTRSVPPHGLVLGNPGRLVDYVTVSGQRLHHDMSGPPPAQELLVQELPPHAAGFRVGR